MSFLEIKMGDDFYLRIQKTPRALHLLKECIREFLEPQFASEETVKENKGR